MFVLKVLGYFVMASMIGFVIDTTLRSVRRRRFAPIRKVPFSPLYGLGGFAILCVPSGVASGPLPALFLYYSVAFCTLEYVAGVLILALRGTRVWDYRDRYYNLHGHTDLFHFFLWGLVGVVCRLWIVGPVAGLVGLAVS